MKSFKKEVELYIVRPFILFKLFPVNLYVSIFVL